MKTLPGVKLSGRDRLGIFDVLAGVDQKGAGLFSEGAVVGPARHDATGGIVEQDLDALFAREIEFHRLSRRDW